MQLQPNASLHDKLTRAYSLFQWFQDLPVPPAVQATVAYRKLLSEIEALQVKPEELASVGLPVNNNITDARLAFMVRFTGLPWSVCSLYHDAIENPSWIKNGQSFLLRYTPEDAPKGSIAIGMPLTGFMDLAFLQPTHVWIVNGKVRSCKIRWNAAESERLGRFIQFASTRHQQQAELHNISTSERFIAAIKATVGV